VTTFDGVLIRIKTPQLWELFGGCTPLSYRTRHGKPALAAQVYIDDCYRIMYVDATSAGSTFDGVTWNFSDMADHLDGYPIPDPYFGLADDAYHNKHGFLTGYGTKASGAEDAFSYAHSVRRQSVECTFGQWFARWPRLKLGLDCELRNAYTVIEAAAILLNVCIDERLQTHWFAPDAEAGDADLLPPLPRHELHLDGDSVGMDAEKYQALLRKLPRADPQDGNPCPEFETQERGTAEL